MYACKHAAVRTILEKDRQHSNTTIALCPRVFPCVCLNASHMLLWLHVGGDERIHCERGAARHQTQRCDSVSRAFGSF